MSAIHLSYEEKIYLEALLLVLLQIGEVRANPEKTDKLKSIIEKLDRT